MYTCNLRVFIEVHLPPDYHHPACKYFTFRVTGTDCPENLQCLYPSKPDQIHPWSTCPSWLCSEPGIWTRRSSKIPSILNLWMVLRVRRAEYKFLFHWGEPCWYSEADGDCSVQRCTEAHFRVWIKGEARHLQRYSLYRVCAVRREIEFESHNESKLEGSTRGHLGDKGFFFKKGSQDGMPGRIQ